MKEGVKYTANRPLREREEERDAASDEDFIILKLLKCLSVCLNSKGLN